MPRNQNEAPAATATDVALPGHISESPKRWWILLMLFLVMTVNVLDRQVLSLVAPVLREEMHFSETAYGAIVFCFLLGMSLGQVPVGTWIDRNGARVGFSVILAFWSLANALHGMARNVYQFAVFRFMLGFAECGTYSAGVKVIGHCFPSKERALASGIFNSGSLVGAIIAPPLIVFLMMRFGWQAAFVVTGIVGTLWIIPWMRMTRETLRADAESRVDLHSSAGIFKQPSARMLLRLSPVWGVILIRAFSGPVSHFYWYWLPEYLKHERGLSMSMIAMFAWMPFFSGGIGNIGGGWLSSELIRRGWTVDRSRKTVMTMAFLLCLFAVGVPFTNSLAPALTLICLAALGVNAVAANLMGLITDLFPQRVLARVSGLTGVGDGVMSMIAMLLTGVVVQHFSYLPVFIAAGVLPLLSLVSLMLLVGKVHRISEEEIMARG